jgi:hypothetical protein
MTKEMWANNFIFLTKNPKTGMVDIYALYSQLEQLFEYSYCYIEVL